jgi:hypothetical protein
VDVHYRGHLFEFKPSLGEAYTGNLVLDERQRRLLIKLTDAEDDDWYLNADGERRPAEELFARSPWSTPGPGGPIKLLCRWLDVHNGTVIYNTPDLYGGELFRWVRSSGRGSPAEPDAAADRGNGY